MNSLTHWLKFLRKTLATRHAAAVSQGRARPSRNTLNITNMNTFWRWKQRLRTGGNAERRSLAWLYIQFLVTATTDLDSASDNLQYWNSICGLYHSTSVKAGAKGLLN
jgi:hypothetical protein